MTQNTPTLFSNAELNAEVRVVMNEANEPWFFGSELATTLGYSNPGKAIVDHVSMEDKIIVDSRDFLPEMEKKSRRGNPNVYLINEFGFYDLVMSSDLPTAKEFKRWVTHEVLPSIRKTGSYSIAQPVDYKLETLKALSAALATNPGATIIAQMLAVNTGMTLPGHSIERGVTVSQFGCSHLGMTGKCGAKVNKLLAEHNYLTKDSFGKWKITPDGSRYLAEYLGSDGLHPQVLVRPDVLDELAEILNN